MSPIAVTIGVDTASRSYPRRYDSTDSPTVTSRISSEASAPPTTEIVTRSQTLTVSSPKADATSFASTAIHTDDVNVVMMLTSTFCASTPPRRRFASNRPAWVAVPSRAPTAPKMVPRMPTAAGIRTRRPGRAASVSVMWLSVSPATNDAAVLRTSATRP
jgi:hypothetical protein